MDTQTAEIEIEEPEVIETDEVDVAAEAEIEIDEGDVVVTFGDDEAPEVESDEAAPAWVKDVRKKNRELSKELSDLKKAQAKADEKPSQLSAKPTLEKAGFDEDKFSEQLGNWYNEKRQHDTAEAAQKEDADKQAVAWQDRMGEYNEGKSTFKPDIIEEAEAVARGVLSETQQGVLIEALGSRAAAVLVGLASSEDRLKALAAIKNPIRFAAHAVRLESSMKKTTRRPKSAPETRVVGSASGGAGDKTLDKLRAEAEKTGDSTKVIAYRKKQREAAK